MSNITEVRKALELLKNEKLKDLASMAASTITKTLYDLHFASFDIIEEYINQFTPKEIKKEFKIVYKSAVLKKGRTRTHHTNNLKNWINWNCGSWKYYPENYLPIEIYNKKDELIFTIKELADIEILKNNIKEIVEKREFPLTPEKKEEK